MKCITFEYGKSDQLIPHVLLFNLFKCVKDYCFRSFKVKRYRVTLPTSACFKLGYPTAYASINNQQR